MVVASASTPPLKTTLIQRSNIPFRYQEPKSESIYSLARTAFLVIVFFVCAMEIIPCPVAGSRCVLLVLLGDCQPTFFLHLIFRDFGGLD